MINEQHNNGQREYFQSADQPSIFPTESPYAMRHIEMLTSIGGLIKGQKVLEVGAGVGRFSRLLYARGLDVTACDISPELIASLRKYSPEIPAFVSDVNELPKQHDDRYDAVVGFFMLHHLPDLPNAFRGMAAMLKPGGKLIFCEPNAWFFPFYLQILLTPRMRWSVDKGVMNMRTGVLSPALEENDLINIEYTHYGFLPPQIYNRGWGRSLDKTLTTLHLPARAHAFQIVVATRVK